MKFVNLTPHAIWVQDGRGVPVVFQPSGQVARLAMESVSQPSISGFRVTGQRVGEIIGLPAPVEGTVYIASMAVATAAILAGRYDVIAPDTGPTAIRIEDGPRKGQIEAVTGFVQYV